jgi:hypothetical protein
MTQISPDSIISYQPPDTTGWPTYAYICDGEVAHIAKVQPGNNYMNAVLSSNPVIIRVPDDKEIEMGYKYAEGVFSPPEAE